MVNQLGRIQNIVHLILENRSFDHMLGFLYPASDGYAGLTGNEKNWSPSTNNNVPVFKIGILPADRVYFMPGTDPGEGYYNYNDQMFGPANPDAKGQPTSGGFVANFAGEVFRKRTKGAPGFLPWTSPNDIMGVYTPDLLPILSTLAKGYAVCDHWFCSAPAHTWPNRAFAAAATSQGHLDNSSSPGWLTSKTIFDALTTDMGQDWRVFGPYGTASHTRMNFMSLLNAPALQFGTMADFETLAASGGLPAYTFIEPDFSADGDSQHPNYDVAKGEQLIYSVYNALRSGPNWNNTLFVITYDEHGGLYDHNAPRAAAVPPGDGSHGEHGFAFNRFGGRVPAVLVSPLIAPGTVFRVSDDQTIDHTSVLKTIFERWGGANPLYLTERDRNAPSLADVLTLDAPRADDPLNGITPPMSKTIPPGLDLSIPSMLDLLHAQQVARLAIPDASGFCDGPSPELPATAKELRAFVLERTAAWDRFRQSSPK